MNTNKTLRGHLAASFCIFIWGITFISTKLLLVDFSPTEILFFRFLLAYAMLFILSPKPILPRFNRQEAFYASAGLCGVTLYFLLQNVGLIYTTASNAGVIVCVAPMLTALVARFFGGGEKIRKNFVGGFLLAIIGCALISFNGSVVLSLNPLGDFLILAGALSWAFYCNLLALADNGAFSLIQTTRKVFFYGLLFLLPVFALTGLSLDPARFLEPENLFNMLFLGVIASGLCFLAWNYAVGILGSVKCAVYIYANPIVTILFAALILGESLNWISGAGTVLTLTGLILSERRKRDAAEASPPKEK